jgi:hypothetical protein
MEWIGSISPKYFLHRKDAKVAKMRAALTEITEFSEGWSF